MVTRTVAPGTVTGLDQVLPRRVSAEPALTATQVRPEGQEMAAKPMIPAPRTLRGRDQVLPS